MVPAPDRANEAEAEALVLGPLTRVVCAPPLCTRRYEETHDDGVQAAEDVKARERDAARTAGRAEARAAKCV